MSNITLRQNLGNTEPRSANVVVKNSGLSNIELDNNFNNINNTVEYNSGNIGKLFAEVSLAYTQANSAFSAANNVAPQIAPAYDTANTALSTAISAYNNSNTKFSSSGGVISGNVDVAGSVIVEGTLTVSGNVTTISANNLSIKDNMIYLNEGNGQNTNPDLGFAGGYNDGIYRHAGFFRDATDGIWKVFDQYVPEPDESIWIDTSNNTFRIADFQANNIYGYINASNLTSGTVSVERLGSGEANSTTYLAGDNSWKPIVSGATLVQNESSNTIYYIGLSSETSGAWLEAFVSPNNLVYNPGLKRLGLSTIDPKATLHIGSNDAIIIPSGSDVERPEYPINGMLRYNTSNNYIESYSNNSWSQVGSGASSEFYYPAREQFVATANQSVFVVDGGYVPGELDVFYNGIKLRIGTEVNVSSGIDFTLSTPAANNALIEICGIATYTASGRDLTTPRREYFVATSNQTIFTISGGYSPGMADVYYNGSKLLNGYDVDVSSGLSIVLTTPASNGAIIDVVALDSLTYLDVVKKSGDSMVGNLTAPAFIGNGAQLTNLDANNITTGTVNSTRLGSGTANSNTYLAGDNTWKEINLSNINANSITSGTVNTAVLGSGVANSSTYLAGDNTWKIISGFSSTDDTSTNATYYPLIATIAGGSTVKTSSSKLYYNPSTGTLSATIFNSLSDGTLKENVETLSSGISIINTINPVSYIWKDSGKVGYGVIAQEIENILPEIVNTNDGIKSVEYNSLIPFLIKSIQELKSEIDQLKSELGR